MNLVEHAIRLQGKKVLLRPMTEQDWELLYVWNNDPEVLFFADGDDVISRSLDEVKKIYRTVSRTAFCFVMEREGIPIGECWLQTMNLKRVLDRYPDKDCRRIDIMIGEKRYWGKGLGTRAIKLLTEFGFEAETADYVFACDVADYNPRSLQAFTRNGYTIDRMIEKSPGSKARNSFDLVIDRTEYKERKR